MLELTLLVLVSGGVLFVFVAALVVATLLDTITEIMDEINLGLHDLNEKFDDGFDEDTE